MNTNTNTNEPVGTNANTNEPVGANASTNAHDHGHHTRLRILREAVLAAKHRERGSFARVFERFFDLTEGAGFFRACEHVDDPNLEALVREVVRSMLPGVEVRNLAMQRFGETGFFHGSILTEAAVGCFLWFEGDGQGLVHLQRFDGRSLETRFRIATRIDADRLDPARAAFTMRAPAGVH